MASGTARPNTLRSSWAPTPLTRASSPRCASPDVVIETLQPAVVQAAAFKADFESTDKLPAGWTAQGKVSVDPREAFKGKHSLLLSRAAQHEDEPCSAVSPAFKVTAGTWEIALAAKSDLVSPDASYQGIALLEWLDASGKAIGSASLAELFKQRNWQAVSKRLRDAGGRGAARFRVELRKTSGKFWVDELSASSVAAAPRKDKRIAAILFSTAQMGNMLFPQDKRGYRRHRPRDQAVEGNPT